MKHKCSKCGVCCRLFLINLTEKEFNSGEYKTQFGKQISFRTFKQAVFCGAATLKQKKDGSCIYLKNNQCSIHNRRPMACIGFFCSSKLNKYKFMVTQIHSVRIKTP